MGSTKTATEEHLHEEHPLTDAKPTLQQKEAKPALQQKETPKERSIPVHVPQNAAPTIDAKDRKVAMHQMSSSVKGTTQKAEMLGKVAAVVGAIVATGWAFMQVAQEDKEGKEGSNSQDRSKLLDNAKVCALFMVIFGHFCYYNGSGEFKGQQAWLKDAGPTLGWLMGVVSPMKLPVLCFVSGICSQGETTPGRLKRFFTFLVAPTLIWVFFVKPVIYDTLIDGSFHEFVPRLMQALRLNAFHEEWYLQALIFWRGAAFLIFNHLRPSVSLAAMLTASFAGGYVQFAAGASMYLKIDETLGFLPYFAAGYVFPYDKALRSISKPDAMSSAVAAFVVLLYTGVFIPYCFDGQLPNGHGPYGTISDVNAWKATGADSLEHRIYWCRRLGRVILDLTATLVWMFLVLPRGKTPLSWVGEHTLEPYVWHILGLTWWDYLMGHLGVPTVTSPFGHAGVIGLNALVSLLALAFFATKPWRTLFAWCFHPTWLQVLADKKPPSTSNHDTRVDKQPAADDAPGAARPPVLPRPGLHQANLAQLSKRQGDSPSETSLLKERVPSVSQLSVRSGASSASVASFVSNVRLPTMEESKGFAPFVLPIFLIGTFAPAVWFFLYFGWNRVLEVVLQIPLRWILIPFAASVVYRVFIYVYHLRRYWKALEPPPPLPEGVEPLLHVCIVVEYKEPIEVLTRTVSSIARQTHLSRRPVLVIATEARDNERHETCEILKDLCGNAVEEFIMTEHTLLPNEIVGKHSNENKAARDIWNLYVEERGMNPFEILLTIIDADSILSEMYLSHVEATYNNMPDGRRLIYNGPLNTYRNLGDCGLLVQYTEICRCHADCFMDPLSPYHPQSNYSMTLGLAQEIDFWLPDCISEDLKCHVKALANNFGSQTTVPVPAFICNDSVTDFADRYVQAKRHQWGSVEELPWHIKLAWDSPVNFKLWYQIFSDEMGRCGSLLQIAVTTSAKILQLSLIVHLSLYRRDLFFDPRFYLFVVMYLFMTWSLWLGEVILCQTVLVKLFPINWPSRCELFLCFLLDFPLQTMSFVCFGLGATVDCIHHMTFKSTTLKYVNAPKS